jgi:MurNAc alpha-1-phosphate uridylyltransferase
MILAAGLGLRMRPITLTLPKPLVPVAGRTMLDRVLDHLDDADCPNHVVNLHYLGAKIRAHLAGRKNIAFSEEPDLLETGGGVAKALPLLGIDPFFVCNADIIWRDRGTSSLIRLADAFDPSQMDALLLLQPCDHAFGYDGKGDFHLAPDGRLRRRGGDETAPFLFAGVQILHPRLFTSVPKEAFSLNLLYDRAMTTERLFGMVHDGDWYHIGTPAALDQADILLAGPL